jgi:hypothetical protein
VTSVHNVPSQVLAVLSASMGPEALLALLFAAFFIHLMR